MPPQQCPQCGRFLKNELVTGLDVGPAPCPRCGERLTAEMFAPDDAGDRLASGGVDSVRPPDLEPETVRDTDVLAGWDQPQRSAEVVELARWRKDRAPFPLDAAVLAGAGVVGAVAGGWRDPLTGRGAALGGLAGVALAAAGRRIWQAPYQP